MSGRESADLIEALAFPLPITVICELLGIPAADQDKFQVWSHAIVSSVVSEEEWLGAGAEMFHYFTALLAAKRRSPADDLTSALIYFLAVSDHRVMPVGSPLLAVIRAG